MVAIGLASSAALILTGCSSGSSGGSLGNSTKSGGEVKSIVVPTNESPWLGAYQKLAAEYTKQSGVKVDLRPMPFDQLTSQMVNDLQSGNHTYDIYQPAESAVNTFYNNKWVTPLADIDPDWKPDKAEINYDNITRWDAKKKINDPSGKLMCQPLNGNIELLMYRQDLLDKLGLKVPKTWDDVVSNGKRHKPRVPPSTVSLSGPKVSVPVLRQSPTSFCRCWPAMAESG